MLKRRDKISQSLVYICIYIRGRSLLMYTQFIKPICELIYLFVQCGYAILFGMTCRLLAIFRYIYTITCHITHVKTYYSFFRNVSSTSDRCLKNPSVVRRSERLMWTDGIFGVIFLALNHMQYCQRMRTSMLTAVRHASKFWVQPVRFNHKSAQQLTEYMNMLQTRM